MEKYNVDYFIRKFEVIPEDRWICGFLTDIVDDTKHCALGHCGAHDYTTGTPESKALTNLFEDNLRLRVYEVNDSIGKLNFKFETPKQRILAALRQIKEEVDQKERIVYVTVDEKVRELQKTYGLC